MDGTRVQTQPPDRQRSSDVATRAPESQTTRRPHQDLQERAGNRFTAESLGPQQDDADAAQTPPPDSEERFIPELEIASVQSSEEITEREGTPTAPELVELGEAPPSESEDVPEPPDEATEETGEEQGESASEEIRETGEPQGEDGGEADAATPSSPTAAGGGGGDVMAASAEVMAQRDEQRARVDEASTAVQVVSGNLAALQVTPITFMPNDDEQSDDRGVSQRGRELRADAQLMAAQFVARNAGQVDQLLAYAPIAQARIAAAVQMQRDMVAAQVTQQKAAISARAEAVRTSVSEKAKAASSNVTALYVSSVAAIGGAVIKAGAGVTSAYLGALAGLQTIETNQMAGIDRVYKTNDGLLRQKGTDTQKKAEDFGEARAKFYLGRKSSSREDIENRRENARAKAARQVAKEYGAELDKAAGEQADKVKELAPKDKEGVTKEVTKLREGLASQYDATLNILSTMFNQGVESASATHDQMLATIEAQKKSTQASVSDLEQAELAKVAAFGQRQMVTIERDGEMAMASMSEGITQAGVTFHEALQAFATSTALLNAPDREALTTVLAESQAQIDAMLPELVSQIETGIVESEMGIAAGGAQAMDAIRNIAAQSMETLSSLGQDFSAGIDTLVQEATATFQQLSTTITTSAATLSVQFTTGMISFIIDTAQSFSKALTQVDARLKETGSELEKGLWTSEIQSNLRKAIHDKAEAAAKEIQPWWKKVIKWVLVVIVVVVVIAVSVLTLGAGAGLGAMILVGAAAGAFSGAAMQMIDNWYKGEDVLQMNVLTEAGKGAVTGAIGGFAGGLGALAAKGVASVGGKIALELGADVIGSIVGDLAVGNPITLAGVLTGAAVGGGAMAAGPALRGLRNLGGRLKTGFRPPGAGAPASAVTPATPSRVPPPSAEPSVAPSRAIGGEAGAAPAPRATAEPTAPRRPAEPTPESAPRADSQQAPRTPQEQGQRAAQEAMSDSADAARQAQARRGREVDQPESPTRPRDEEPPETPRQRREDGDEPEAPGRRREDGDEPEAPGQRREDGDEPEAPGRRREDGDEPEAPGRRREDGDEPEAPGRKRDAADEAARKAAELPQALAAARAIAEANDKIDTPVPALLPQLNALKRRYRWIKGFKARAKAKPGAFSIVMLASEHEADPEYTIDVDELFKDIDDHEANAAFRRAKEEGRTPEELDQLATDSIVASDLRFSQRLHQAGLEAQEQGLIGLNWDHVSAALRKRDEIRARNPAHEWLEQRGQQILYRGQGTDVVEAGDQITSAMVRGDLKVDELDAAVQLPKMQKALQKLGLSGQGGPIGIQDSEKLHQHLINEGFTPQEIAGFTAKFNNVGIHPYLLDPKLPEFLPAGSAGIPSSTIPGVSAGFMSGDDAVLYILRAPKGKAVQVGDKGWAVQSQLEDEWVFFHKIENDWVVGRVSEKVDVLSAQEMKTALEALLP